MEPAPYFAELSKSESDARTVWSETSDGVRIRLAFWGREDARGTVIIFPGRTEFIEKYSRLAQDLSDAGLASAAIDWRGQGVAERLLDNPLLGHVGAFHDYQRDVAELVAFLTDAGAPRPWHLLGHSMGGAIGLRSLINGLDVKTAVFSAPMWGIAVPVLKRPVAATLPGLAKRLGREMNLIPGGDATSHIAATDFSENLLTSDPEHYAWFKEQLRAKPEMELAGPSIRWLGEAMNEARLLKSARLPDIPSLIFMGTREEVVSKRAITTMVDRWSSARLEVVEGALHEIFMERSEMRAKCLQLSFAHWGLAEVVA